MCTSWCIYYTYHDIPLTCIGTVSGLPSRNDSKAITLPPSLRRKLLWRCRGRSGRETTHPKSSKDERWWKHSQEFRASFEALHSLTILTYFMLKDLCLTYCFFVGLASRAPRPSYDNGQQNVIFIQATCLFRRLFQAEYVALHSLKR